MKTNRPRPESTRARALHLAFDTTSSTAGNALIGLVGSVLAPDHPLAARGRINTVPALASGACLLRRRRTNHA